MAKSRILIQLDPDSQASVFDAVVAVDAHVEHLLQYHSVQPEQVRDLVHGAMFTRSPQDLASTAVFVGGSNVAKGEELLKQITNCFFGPLRVSVLLDANGANTTAAAAVLAAARHVELQGATATILAGTGPVGQRAARLLVRQGATVRLASRTLPKAEEACQAIRGRMPDASIRPVAVATIDDTVAAVSGAQIVIAAGAAGIRLLSAEAVQQAASLKVAIDLNAVPPLGIEGIEVLDKAQERGGVLCYGAIGVGGTKMKIHRAAIEKLFTRSDLVLDAEEVFALGQDLAK